MATRLVRMTSALGAAALGIATLAACSSDGPAAAGATAGARRAGHTTVVFTAHDEQGNMALEDLGTRSAPGGPDLGDLLAFTQSLSRAGKQVGEVHVVAVGVDHTRHLSEADGTIALRNGTIQLAGIVAMTPHFSLAVTGGTGAYRGATGSIDFTASDAGQTLVVRLVS